MWIDDNILRDAAQSICLSVFVPRTNAVVLGSSNQAELEVDVEACREDGIPILKRYGGGGTVLLYPGCVVVSLGCWVKDYYANDRYFRLINGAIIKSLAEQWPILAQLKQQGISDIAFENRKIAGTSMFRSRNYLLFQASILVDSDDSLISRYLRHPSKEPSYRGRRSHKEFLCGLSEIAGCRVDNVVECLTNSFSDALKYDLAGELIEVQSNQLPNLQRRFAGGA